MEHPVLRNRSKPEKTLLLNRESEKKVKNSSLGGATPSDPLAHSGSVGSQFVLAESFSKESIYPER
jgi:hypothetical protein